MIFDVGKVLAIKVEECLNSEKVIGIRAEQRFLVDILLCDHCLLRHLHLF